MNLELGYKNSPARGIVAEYLQNRWQEALGITVPLAPIVVVNPLDIRGALLHEGGALADAAGVQIPG